MKYLNIYQYYTAKGKNMNIFTIYTIEAGKLLAVLDDLTAKKPVKGIASDPYRLYNDSKHNDVPMASITIMCEEPHEEVVATISNNYVYVCEEDANDWA